MESPYYVTWYCAGWPFKFRQIFGELERLRTWRKILINGGHASIDEDTCEPSDKIKKVENADLWDWKKLKGS